MEVIKEYMQKIYANGLYPDEYIGHGNRRGNLVDIEEVASGKKMTVLTFCTNDVLGLVQNKNVQQAAIDAIVQYGTSNSSCEALSGRIDLHRQLENEISEFKHLPHTHLFLNAWMALQALMDAFCHLAIPVPGFQHTRETLIMSDILNHGCIISAITNANNRSGKVFSQSPEVRVKAYRHNSMTDLKQKLKRYVKPGDRIIVIADAVFSMDGDIAPLPEMLDVMADYPGSVLVMDEAHASGAIGKTGRGVYEHYNMTPQDVLDRGVEPIVMTTFSKFAASAGAALSSFSPEFNDLLTASPTSIGTISLPAPTTAAALQSIREVRKAPELVDTLQSNTRYLRSRLIEHEFEPSGVTNVVPIVLPPELDPKEFCDRLMHEHGIWVSAIWFIAKPRLRITVNALHTKEEMDRLVSALVTVRDAMAKARETVNA